MTIRILDCGHSIDDNSRFWSIQPNKCQTCWYLNTHQDAPQNAVKANLRADLLKNETQSVLQKEGLK